MKARRGFSAPATSPSSRMAMATSCAATQVHPRRASSSSSASSSASATRSSGTAAGGSATTLICGAVRFDHPAARNLVEILPEIIHVDAAARPHGDWMPALLGLMAAEARELRPGGEAVITRLGDVLVIQALRAWLETDPAARTGWLGALQDRQIGPAIALIHRDPARAWTVASLADELAMSRSAFAARFTELVGEPVMAYVTRWRMQVAVGALRDEGATVGELANRLGYRSEAAFSRAFKRVVGVAPGAVRKTERAAALVAG